MGRLVDTDDVMQNIVAEYKRQHTLADGLIIARIEQAVNDTPTAELYSGWIDVNDRLPEDDGFVVAFVESGTWNHVTFERCIEIASYDTEDGCGWVLEHYPMAKVNITHWMDPLDPLGRPRLPLDTIHEGRL
jgi:hypothetical protein